MSGTHANGYSMQHYAPKKKFKTPANWINCPSMADTTIAEDLFVVFKTPLDFKFNKQVHSKKRFNTDMVFSVLAERKVDLGLWIDLTNTDQYYDRSAVECMNCEYVKIFCTGKKPPTQSQTRAFISVCSHFIENNPLKKIGIHCTHGFNRTGFMIVAYLIEKLNYSVPNALALFAAVRPPGIYRQYLISELYSRYSIEEPNLAPKFPSWVIDKY